MDSSTPRNLFFTGKGGVGKTSAACAAALELADAGLRVLLVSTDPASNLDEVLGVGLGASLPTAVPGVAHLWALNVDPEAAAAAYRERVVGPVRGLLPAAIITSMVEQLSGACTVEIAAFDQFAGLLGDPEATLAFDRVVFDTAPTGHTLRLLELPAAWTGFLDTNTTGTSCLGPLSGLQEQRAVFSKALEALRSPATTRVVLVTRPERASLREADRTAGELADLGIGSLHLIVNGVFDADTNGDPIAHALSKRGRDALAEMPARLQQLPRQDVPLLALAPVGLKGLRALIRARNRQAPMAEPAALPVIWQGHPQPLYTLVADLAAHPRGVVFTMGKGGVGKTSVAVQLARALAQRGVRVHLTTTDPAAHIAEALGSVPAGLRLGRIDPAAEVQRYTAQVLATAGADLDDKGLALLAEDLRSPCTEEIAVFQAFAEVVASGQDELVIIDTAPTGHTLLLLDAAEAYHREVSRKPGAASEAVRMLLPRLRDPAFARILLVTLPEATPVHEAAALERDLRRAGIEPYAWVVNQVLTGLELHHPLLRARQAAEARFLAEVDVLAPRVAHLPWSVGPAASTGPSAPQPAYSR